MRWFARHEVLMQEIMATVSGADATSIRLLTNGLTFSEKHDALFNLLRHRTVPIDRIDHVRKFLRVLQTFAPLRSDIAHCEWIEGKPQHLISPAWLTSGHMTAIKAVHDIGEHKKEYVEDADDKNTYTLDNLKNIVEHLEINYLSFREYAAEIGLTVFSKE